MGLFDFLANIVIDAKDQATRSQGNRPANPNYRDEMAYKRYKSMSSSEKNSLKKSSPMVYKTMSNREKSEKK